MLIKGNITHTHTHTCTHTHDIHPTAGSSNMQWQIQCH